jgi:hypothetical protein
VIKELELEAEVENSESAKAEHKELLEWRQGRIEKITSTNEVPPDPALRLSRLLTLSLAYDGHFTLGGRYFDRLAA